MSEQRATYSVTYSATPIDESEATVTMKMSPTWAKLFYRLANARNSGAAGAWVDLDAVTVSIAPLTEILTRG